MTPEQALEYIPNPYTQGEFYPADDGWEVAETWGRGRNHGKKYITARRMRWSRLVDHHGNVLKERYRQEWQRFRAELDADPHWQPLDDGYGASLWRIKELHTPKGDQS